MYKLIVVGLLAASAATASAASPPSRDVKNHDRAAANLVAKSDDKELEELRVSLPNLRGTVSATRVLSDLTEAENRRGLQGKGNKDEDEDSEEDEQESDEQEEDSEEGDEEEDQDASDEEEDSSEGGDEEEDNSEGADEEEDNSEGADEEEDNSEGGDEEEDNSEGADEEEDNSEGGDEEEDNSEGGDEEEDNSEGGDEEEDNAEGGDEEEDSEEDSGEDADEEESRGCAGIGEACKVEGDCCDAPPNGCFTKKNNNGRGTCEASCPADKAYKCYKKPDEVADRDGGDGACKDDGGWEKHPAKKGKTLDCDWVAKSPKKRCKKKNKGGTKASKACACACA
ncbi:unnamed protein product [Pelagomonas calceolata]|uniref:Uncharacterized protein n=1 Tax=Pelagomonas calceolata TaxID=35677 RepID=A0A8J2SZ84_9STRA|nr:unnamed protein product [Pelagomonas calceolata]